MCQGSALCRQYRSTRQFTKVGGVSETSLPHSLQLTYDLPASEQMSRSEFIENGSLTRTALMILLTCSAVDGHKAQAANDGQLRTRWSNAAMFRNLI